MPRAQRPRSSGERAFAPEIREAALGLVQRDVFRAVQTALRESAQRQQLYSLSGMDDATSLQLPLGWGENYLRVPALNGHLYTPITNQTPFEKMFNLTPIEKESEGGGSTSAERIAEKTQARIADALADAIALFREGSVRESSSDRARADMGRAVRRLAIVNQVTATRSADRVLSDELILFASPENAESRRVRLLPPVLLIHGYLSQDRIQRAIAALDDAVQRSATVFDEHPGAIAAYFGDYDVQLQKSAVLTEQLGIYIRVADSNVNVSDGYLISAYCAWRLGDPRRAEDLLDRGGQVEISETGRISAKYARISAALRSALSTRAVGAATTP